MGAKRGRAKGNEQQSRVREAGRKTWETRSERRRKAREAKAERAHRGSSCEAESGREGKEEQRLSSEVLKRKGPKGSGRDADERKRNGRGKTESESMR